MARVAIQLNRVEFQNLVTQVEEVHKPQTRSNLWQHVEESDWAKAQQPRPLTAQVAMLKAKEMGLDICTPLGKRGREKGQGLPVAARDALRGPRKKREAVSPEVVAKWKKRFPTQLKTIEKAAIGNTKSCIKMNCLDCSGSRGEVTLCEVTDCFFWKLRPYQGKKAVAQATAEKVAEETRIDAEVERG